MKQSCLNKYTSLSGWLLAWLNSSLIIWETSPYYNWAERGSSGRIAGLSQEIIVHRNLRAEMDLSVLRFRQDKSQSLGQLSAKLEHSTPLFPPQGEARSWKFSLDLAALCWERDYGEWMPWMFLLSLMWFFLATGSLGVQEPLNWFWYFSQRQLL